MKPNRKKRNLTLTVPRLGHLIALVVTLLLSQKSLHAQSEKPAAKLPAESITGGSTQVAAGNFTIEIPSGWEVSTGPESKQLKAEIKAGIDQMINQYRAESGQATPLLGIQDFKAIRLSNASGWCIMHYMRIPPVSDYYGRMKEDTRQKIEWGKQNGIMEKVGENGTVTIGGTTVWKAVLYPKGGGRMITMAYWSPKTPGLVSQIMVVQNNGDARLTEQVDAAIKTVAVTTPK